MIGVFGANGFLGRHLVESLLSTDREAVAVARVFDGAFPDGPRLRRVMGDLRDASAMAFALRGVDTVVQLMASSTPAQGNTRATEDILNNVVPHVDFLDMCLAAGVRRIVFLSSGGTVYGPVTSLPVPETHPANPISSHGVTKLMVEKFIKLHSHLHDLEHVILRVANPFGPGQVYRKGQGLIPALLQRYDAGQPINVFGDGSAARDYIYVSDVVSAILASCDLPVHAATTLNVGTGQARSILDVVHAIEEVSNIEFDINFLPARESDVDRISLDITRARDVLNWHPTVPFKEGLSTTLRSRSR